MKVIYLLLAALMLGGCATPKKPKPEEFTVELDSPNKEIGQIEVQFDRILSIGGLRKTLVKVSYYPLEDAVCIQYRDNFVTYYQFWSKDGREFFIKSLAAYNNDYTEKKLDRKSRRSRQKYGAIEGFLTWQLHRFAIKAFANMIVELGYDFKERFPYFTINQLEAFYIDPVGRDNNRDSPIITMFFTRAQADQLAALFDNNYLYGLDIDMGRTFTPDVEYDEY